MSLSSFKSSEFSNLLKFRSKNGQYYIQQCRYPYSIDFLSEENQFYLESFNNECVLKISFEDEIEITPNIAEFVKYLYQTIESIKSMKKKSLLKIYQLAILCYNKNIATNFNLVDMIDNTEQQIQKIPISENITNLNHDKQLQFIDKIIEQYQELLLSHSSSDFSFTFLNPFQINIGKLISPLLNLSNIYLLMFLKRKCDENQFYLEQSIDSNLLLSIQNCDRINIKYTSFIEHDYNPMISSERQCLKNQCQDDHDFVLIQTDCIVDLSQLQFRSLKIGHEKIESIKNYKSVYGSFSIQINSQMDQDDLIILYENYEDNGLDFLIINEDEQEIDLIEIPNFFYSNYYLLTTQQNQNEEQNQCKIDYHALKDETLLKMIMSKKYEIQNILNNSLYSIVIDLLFN